MKVARLIFPVLISIIAVVLLVTDASTAPENLHTPLVDPILDGSVNWAEALSAPLPSATSSPLPIPTQTPGPNASATDALQSRPTKTALTRTPHPTPTPIVIITPTNPSLLQIMLILGTVALIIVVLSVLIIRKRT